MNEARRNSLQRGLQWLAILCVPAFLAAVLLNEFYVSQKIWAEIRTHNKREVEALLARTMQASNQAQSGLERLSALVDRLDGNAQTQRALSAAVAQDTNIGEVWVTDAQGRIVYYGRYQPPAERVADYPARPLQQLFDEAPAGLLQPVQQTAILLPLVLSNFYHLAAEREANYGVFHLDSKSKRRSFFESMEAAFETHFLFNLSTDKVEVGRVKDGLIAVVAAQSVYGEAPIISPWLATLNEATKGATLASLILFWLAVPGWMALDARQRRERSLVWGLFGLLGNAMALVVYLLVRQGADGTAEEGLE